MEFQRTERTISGSSNGLLNSTSPIRPRPVSLAPESDEETSTPSREPSDLDHDPTDDSDESDESFDVGTLEDTQQEERPDQAHYKIDEVEDHPHGVPRLAAFLNSSESFNMYRYYGWSHARILMHLQIEINEIEKALRRLDKQDSRRPYLRWHRLTMVELQPEQNQDNKQHVLIMRLDEKLNKYDDLLLKYSRILNLGRPSEQNYKSVFTWINDKKPLAKEQRDFIEMKDDFVSLVPKTTSKTWIQGQIESYYLHTRDSWAEWFVNTEPEKQKTRDLYTMHMSPARLNILTRGFAILTTSLLHLVPVILLSMLDLGRGLMAFIVCCFIFAFEITIFSVAERTDVIIGTAAYSAMLLAFQQIYNN